MDIQTGSIVKLAGGIVGEVVRSWQVNGATFHKVEQLTVTTWGTVIRSPLGPVADDEIVAIRKAASVAETTPAA